MYALLCNYAGKNDHCWPSHGTLASELGCSVSSVKNYLRELQAINLISVQHEGRFRSSTYYMLKPSSSGSVSEPKVDYQVAKNWLLNNLTNKNTIYPPLPPSSAKPPRAAAHVSPTKSGGGGDFLSANRAFEKFWETYPRKEAKEIARAAWRQLWRHRQLPALDVLSAALDNFKTSPMWLKEHGRFVPHPANWLRGQRWQDAPSLDPNGSLTPEEKDRREQTRQALAFFEKQERARQAEHDNETARLRPEFEAFLARFADGQKMRGPAWGLWCMLHKKGNAPHAAQAENADMGVLDFLKNHRPVNERSCGCLC